MASLVRAFVSAASAPPRARLSPPLIVLTPRFVVSAASLPGRGSVNAAFFMLPFVIDTGLTAITFYKVGLTLPNLGQIRCADRLIRTISQAYTIQKITGHSDILRLFMR